VQGYLFGRPLPAEALAAAAPAALAACADADEVLSSAA
jgi:EAL domain-containing protein (putative c-di-GMP-specific phosphodiesterase class I)